MNGCEKFRQLIIRFFAKDLTENETQRLIKHIGECEKCKIEFTLQKEIENMLTNMPLLEAPKSIVKKALSLIPEKNLAYEKPLDIWRIAISICCVGIAWAITIFRAYFPSPLTLINTLLKDTITLLTRFISLSNNPYFIIGSVIYSLILSSFFILLFRRNLMRQTTN